MFMPGAEVGAKQAEEARNVAFKMIERWALEFMPAEIRDDAVVSSQEVMCGDPDCAPIDTAVTIQFSSGCQGILGLPMEAREVTQEELASTFPTREVLEKWYHGEDADWPPVEEPEMPELRFDLGQRVLCRIGPDAEKDWAPGTVILLWYREKSWPPGSFAPYKIKLDDGRSIFAPGDMDQVIRRNPDACSS